MDKTSPEVLESLQDAAESVGDSLQHSMAWYHLGVAAVQALLSIAAAIRDVADRLPEISKGEK